MAVVTLFEHQAVSYEALGWTATHPAVNEIERLNYAYGEELLQVGRRGLRATHFVGVFHAGGFTVQVLPKIDYDPGGDADAGKGAARRKAEHAATRNLLYLLSYTKDLRVREREVASLLAQRSDWFEILTRLFASDLHRLMQRGMDRSYVSVEDTLPVMRGRWQIARQLVRRPHVRHLFDVSYDEFSPDTPLNRVFKHVADRLLMRVESTDSRRMLRDVRDWMSEVYAPGVVTSDQLDRANASITRLNEHFLPAFNLARMFLENEALQLSEGSRETYAFVFDMNRLFEEFVTRFMSRYKREILSPEWRTALIGAQSQDGPLYLAQRLPDGQSAFRLIPDLLLKTSSGETLLILDTKYKRLRTSKKQPISSEDVYQMLAYAIRLECPRVTLLYPQQKGVSGTRLEYEVEGSSERLLVATIDLHRSLAEPGPLIDELREILHPLSNVKTGKVTAHG